MSRSQHFEGLGFGALCPVDEHRSHLDPVHELLYLYPQDVPDRGARRNEDVSHSSPGLPCAGRPPGPLTVVTRTGQFDLHPGHG